MLAEAFKFPEINSILRWADIFSSFNKIALIAVAAAVIGIVVFLLAGNKDASVAPKGVRNLAETTVEFIEDGIVMQTMGKSGLGWTPFLLSLFVFIYLCNVPGIIPILQMPATARMAIPMFLALLVWVVYNGVGQRNQFVQSPLSSAVSVKPGSWVPAPLSRSPQNPGPSWPDTPSPNKPAPGCAWKNCCAIMLPSTVPAMLDRNVPATMPPRPGPA